MVENALRLRVMDDAVLAAAAEQYGTPFYIYYESQLRKNCRDIKALLPPKVFMPRYSAKANANPYLLQVIHQEGFGADAMSPGEIQLLLKSGFAAREILFVAQNAALEEVVWADQLGCTVCVDSLDLLEAVSRNTILKRVAIRINPGIGDGHCDKVVTGGRQSQFGIPIEQFQRVLKICSESEVRIVGLHQHIGSAFLQTDIYLSAAGRLAALCGECPDLEWIDIGGGFGVPYLEREDPIDLKALSHGLMAIVESAKLAAGRPIMLHVEPGRYIVAECGLLVGRVMSVKRNGPNVFVGTDMGFHRLIRPTLYHAVHQPVLIPQRNAERVHSHFSIVGNACETGDILCRHCEGPLPYTGDYLVFEKAGAYGYAMAFPYVGRTRPAEVLVDRNDRVSLIRRHEPLSSLWRLVPGFETH